MCGDRNVDAANLTEFERLAVQMSCSIFLDLTNISAGIDDKLAGKRSKDVPVRSLGARKVSDEGHTTDVFADFCYHCIHQMRYRRRGEGSTSVVQALGEAVHEVCADRSVCGGIMRIDRRYNRQ